MSFIMFTARLGIFLTVLSYVLRGNNITAENVFVIGGYYMIVRQTLTVYFPQGVNAVSVTCDLIGIYLYTIVKKKVGISQNRPLKIKRYVF